MELIPVNIIESDTLTRDALMLYLSKSPQFRILFSGPFSEYLSAKSGKAKINILGEHPQEDVISQVERLQREADTQIIVLSQGLRVEQVLELLEYKQVRGILYKSEINRDIGSAVLYAELGSTIFTKSVAELILSHQKSPQIYRPQIIQSELAIDLNKDTDLTLFLFAVLGLSKEEIADELCISLNTVSSRVRASYLKLGVSNRHDTFEALTKSKLEYLETK